MPRTSHSTSSNLNERVQHVKCSTHACNGKITTHFEDCENAVLQAIQDASSVVACVAWITNEKLLRAMYKTPSKVIVTSDPVHRRNAAKLRKLREARIVGTARGRFRPLMHCKFIVGLDTENQPQFVLIGSFNYTVHSTRNLEAMVRIDDSTIARSFYIEWQRIRQISRPI